MTSDPRRAIASLAAAVLLVGGGCADVTRGDEPVPPDTVVVDATGDGVSGPSYAGGIRDLLVSGCAQCHTTGAPRPFLLGADADSDYEAVVELVVVEDPPSSVLLRKGAGFDGHGAGRIWAPSSDEYQQVEAWIAAGAPP